MADIIKNRMNLLIVPIIMAIIWAFMAYSIVVMGRYTRFAQYILPMSYILFATYFFGLFFWYKIEQTEYRKKIDVMEMDLNSFVSRVERIENFMAEIRKKEE